MVGLLVSKFFYAKKDYNQGLSTVEPRCSNAVSTLRVHPPTSPCPTLSANAEPIVGSDIMKLKVS